MDVLAKQKMTVDEFLAWADGREGRWELADGLPVRLSPQRAVHCETRFAAAKALETAIAATKLPCEMLYGGLAIRLDSNTAYLPDVIVYCGERLSGDAMEVANPIATVEVLSPATSAAEMQRRVRRYFELSSIQHYLILDADNRTVIHHARGTGDALLTRIVSDGELRLDPPGFSVEVQALFPEPYEG